MTFVGQRGSYKEELSIKHAMLYMYTYAYIYCTHLFPWTIYLTTHHIYMYELNRARSGFMHVNKTRTTFGNPDQIWQPKVVRGQTNFARTNFCVTAPGGPPPPPPHPHSGSATVTVPRTSFLSHHCSPDN